MAFKDSLGLLDSKPSVDRGRTASTSSNKVVGLNLCEILKSAGCSNTQTFLQNSMINLSVTYRISETNCLNVLINNQYEYLLGTGGFYPVTVSITHKHSHMLDAFCKE